MNIVDSNWLNKNINDKDIKILDCSWHLPNTSRDGRSEFLNERIPSSIFFDIDFFSDQDSEYPHMLSDKKTFSHKMSMLGLENKDHIICYDSIGIFSAARASWTIGQYGHEKVSILDGGLRKWKIDEFKIEKGDCKTLSKSNYIASKEPDDVVNFEDIKINIIKNKFQLIDARPKGRYEGTDPEPRAELKSGHIEKSRNIPFSYLINEKTGCLKNDEELKKIFNEHDIKGSENAVFSCGSGVAATVVGMAYKKIFNKNFKIYDGSWTEWALKNKILK